MTRPHPCVRALIATALAEMQFGRSMVTLPVATALPRVYVIFGEQHPLEHARRMQPALEAALRSGADGG